METSCGVVLVNYGTVLLLQYPQGHWDLPKGHVEEEDADKKSTAARELHEETGINEIDFVNGFEAVTQYSFTYKKKLTTKRVFWYIATTDKISVNLSKEHRDYMWLDWTQAIDLITHDETRDVLISAKAHLEECNIY